MRSSRGLGRGDSPKMKFFAVLALIACSIAFVVKSSGSDGPSGPISGAPVATISTGEVVQIEEHLEDGTWTLIEYTADW